MLVFCIFTTLVWIVAAVFSCFSKTCVRKMAFLIPAMEIMCFQMVICTPTVLGRTAIVVLSQFVIAFSFLAGMYKNVAYFGDSSKIEEAERFNKITKTEPSRAYKIAEIYIILAAVFGIVAIITRTILIFPGTETNIWGFGFAVFLFIVALFMMIAPGGTEELEYQYAGGGFFGMLCASAFFAIFLVAVPPACYQLADRIDDEAGYRITESSEILLPIEGSNYFYLASPDIGSAEPDTDYYLVGGIGKMESYAKDNAYYYLSANGTDLQYVMKDDTHIKYEENAIPRIVKHQTWGMTKYSKRPKVDKIEYYIYLPDESCILN